MGRTIAVCLSLAACLSAQPPTVPWSSYAHDSQHTGLSTIGVQRLERIKWSTPVNLAPQDTPSPWFVRYGPPLVTAGNTVLVPVRTSPQNTYRVEAHNGATGTLLYSLPSDYSPPPSGRISSYSPALSRGTRLYYQGAGGTIYYRDQPDSAAGPSGQMAFYGNALYAANQAAFNATVTISTPITADAGGNIYFGFEITGSNPAHLTSGLARIAADGTGSWIDAPAAAGGDPSIVEVALNCAPAVSYDGLTVYFVVSEGPAGHGYLVAVSSTTLAPLARIRLQDPETGADAQVPDSSASPAVGPDGDVYYPVMESSCCATRGRGWLLHFDRSLAQIKTPGAFGGNTTVSVAPSNLVASYSGSSSYLLFTRYQDRIAVLDPHTPMTDPITGAMVTREVLAIVQPGVNSSVIDPFSASAIATEDGAIYRWDIAGNSLLQRVTLSGAAGEADTSMAIGADGMAYAISGAVLFAVGQASNLTIASSHTGSLMQGQAGAIYTLTAANSGLGTTQGSVTVTDTLPDSLTATGIGGQGWSCAQPSGPCTRSDALPPGDSYPPLTLTVNVAGDAPSTVTNTAEVSSDGAANSLNSTADDVTAVNPALPPRPARTHLGAFVPLQITTTSVPTATQYLPYSATLAATGGVAPYTWSVVSSTGVSLPEGMSLNPATGVVSAAQVNGQGGYAVTVQVADSSSPSPSIATAALKFGVYSDTGLGGCQMFPPDSIYNQRVDLLPVDTNLSHQIPSGYLASPIHPDFGHGFYPTPGGVPWMRVPSSQPTTNVNLAGDGQIDAAGAYAWPLPAWPNAVVEGTSYGPAGPDHHILILDTNTSGPCTLYETYQNTAVPDMFDAGNNTWYLAAGVHYVLNSDEIAASASVLDNGAQDSAGVPIVPLLLRYREVPEGTQHPLRITFPSPTNWFLWPGTGCCAGSGPPQGLLYRLKASVNWQAACPASSNPQAATVLQALQQYGAYMSDRGQPGFVQGVPDVRWDDNDLACIKNFTMSDLEVVDNSALEVSPLSGQTAPYVAPATLPVFVVGTAYNATISAVGGNPASRKFWITSGTLPPGLSLDPVAGAIGGTPTSSAGSPYIFGITANDTASAFSSLEQRFILGITVSPVPDLTVALWHTGNYTLGQTGVMYSINVTNSGTAPTSGLVTVVDTLPAGMTATAISGSGWTCTLATVTCTYSGALAAGATSLVSVTVTVGYTVPYVVTNIAMVSGGGEIDTANDQSTDITIVTQQPDLTVACAHTGSFTQGQTGASYSITVTNLGGPPTNGTVKVVDTLPAGLTATAMSGVSWSCTLATLTCTRGDSLPGGASYPVVNLTVNVATNAPPSVTNIVTVSGGGEGNTANDQASDPTTIIPYFSPCDVNRYGTTNLADIQQVINEALGLGVAVDDLNGDSLVNVTDVQIVLNAALGLGCSASTGS